MSAFNNNELLYDNLIKLQEQYHKNCLFNTNKLNFESYFNSDGSFDLNFFCDKKFQGYDGMLHGGVISALFDSAMTKCLFGYGIKAYTIRLNIKYIKPVNINNKITIVVNIKDDKPETIISLNASLLQNDHKAATANAKFWVIKTDY